MYCFSHTHADAGPQEPEEVDALTKNTNDSPPSKLEIVKDTALVTGRFIKTLLQRLPDVADGDPIKVAFGITKLILDIVDVGHTYPC